MTNDVEKLILSNNSNVINNIDYADNISYLFYKEIWKFVLFINKVRFKDIYINFKLERVNDLYFINKNDGVKYEALYDDEVMKNRKTFYNKRFPTEILDNPINIRLLFELLKNDNFYYDYLDDEENEILVNVSINKFKVDKCINKTLIKNKILKKIK